MLSRDLVLAEATFSPLDFRDLQVYSVGLQYPSGSVAYASSIVLAMGLKGGV